MKAAIKQKASKWNGLNSANLRLQGKLWAVVMLECSYGRS